MWELSVSNFNSIGLTSALPALTDSDKKAIIALCHNIISTNTHKKQKLWRRGHPYLAFFPLHILDETCPCTSPFGTPRGLWLKFCLYA